MITRIGGTHRYSDIVTCDRNVYLSGIVAYNTCDLSDSNVYIQTKEVLTHLDKYLITVGSSKEYILSMTIYLRDENSYDEMNKAFDEWIAPKCAPARATIGNIRLPNPKWLVEIVCTAMIPSAQSMNFDNVVNYII